MTRHVTSRHDTIYTQLAADFLSIVATDLNVVPAMPRNVACRVVARNQDDAYATLTLARQTVYATARKLACQ